MAPIMRRLSWIFLIVVLGLPAMAIAFGGGVWPFELAHHFMAHLAVVASLACAFYAVSARRLQALAAGAMAMAYATNSLILPAAAPGAAAVASSAPSEPVTGVKLVSFNILADQETPDDLLAWLARGPADVLVLLESTPAWRARLAALSAVYPYQIVALPRDGLPEDSDYDLAGASGIAVLSRLPLSHVRIFYPAGPIKPAVKVTVRAAGGEFTLVAVHPTSPMTKAGLAARDAYLAGLAGALAGDKGPLVVAGDFNATRFTPRFRRFLDSIGLDPPGRSPATYPAVAGPFGLAIDHVLVRGLALRRLDAVPALGSDHRGLMARLVLRAAPGELARLSNGSIGSESALSSGF